MNLGARYRGVMALGCSGKATESLKTMLDFVALSFEMPLLRSRLAKKITSVRGKPEKTGHGHAVTDEASDKSKEYSIVDMGVTTMTTSSILCE